MDAFTKPIWFIVYTNYGAQMFVPCNFKCAVFKQHRRQSPGPLYLQSLHWPESDYQKHTSERKKK